MSDHLRRDASAALALALLRATLVVVIFISAQLVNARQLADSYFFVVLAVAGGYALLGIVVALRPINRPHWPQTTLRLHPGFDVALLVGLTYTSGAAYSDARKAFFVIPLAAAFSERPLSTAKWSLVAVASFTAQAALAGGHLPGALNSWQRLTLNQDLYLAWTGAAATLLAFALRHRSAQIKELAQSRQRLVTQAMDSVERERTRLANALHDSPVQSLIAARLELRRAERTGDRDSFIRLHEALDLTIAELRKEIFDLHPHVLDHVGLKAALEQVARRQATGSDVRVTVVIDPDEHFPHHEILFALGRELLCNAAKHAQAHAIQLSLTRQPGSMELEVADDGCGIASGRVHQALLDGHIGLAAVGERVAALGGSVAMTTALGAGTTVSVTLPDPDASPQTASRANDGPPDRVTSYDTLWVSPARA